MVRPTTDNRFPLIADLDRSFLPFQLPCEICKHIYTQDALQSQIGILLWQTDRGKNVNFCCWWGPELGLFEPSLMFSSLFFILFLWHSSSALNPPSYFMTTFTSSVLTLFRSSNSQTAQTYSLLSSELLLANLQSSTPVVEAETWSDIEGVSARSNFSFLGIVSALPYLCFQQIYGFLGVLIPFLDWFSSQDFIFPH